MRQCDQNIEFPNLKLEQKNRTEHLRTKEAEFKKKIKQNSRKNLIAYQLINLLL